MPSQLHLILASRSDPPLPLARLRCRDLLCEFHADDLRFIPDEGAVFLNQVMNLNLSAGDVSALAARTEGWIAGLQFAALSLRSIADPGDRHHFIDNLSGRDRQLVDYLLAEVLQRQPETIQHFLLHTAILGRMNGALCEAVSGRPDGEAVLGALDRAHLFIIPLDNERNWYRYHHLFAELLRQCLAQVAGEAGVADLHRRASQWFEAHALPDEAIDHALAAADFDRAAQLLTSLLPDTLWGKGAVTRVRRWLEAFPLAVLPRYPRLGVTAAVLAYMAYNPVQGLSYLQTVPPAASLPDDVRCELIRLQANLLRNRGDIASAVALLQQTLAQLPADTSELHLIIYFELGSASLESVDLTASDHYWAKALAIARPIERTYLVLEAIHALGVIANARGQLHQAADRYQEILDAGASRTGQLMPAYGKALVGLGWLCCEWNRLDEAANYFDKGVVQGEQLGVGDILWHGYQGQAFLWQRQGNKARMTQVLDKLKTISRKLSASGVLPRVMAETARFEAELAFARGDLAAVARWVETVQPGLDEMPVRIWGDHWLLARFLITQSRVSGDPSALPAVVAMLCRLMKLLDTENQIDATIRLQILLALAYQAQNKPRQALKALGQALTLALPSGYVRVFLDEGSAMQMLLQQALKHDLLPDYVRQLLNAFQDEPSIEIEARRTDQAPAAGDRTFLEACSFEEGGRPPRFAIHPFVEPLTMREREVIQQIANGHSNQEIAEKLVLSLNTVRSHIKNAYSKLNVRSRIQAVEAARRLNIL
jgi:LuxR family maltose regulon positive regulatory protein